MALNGLVLVTLTGFSSEHRLSCSAYWASNHERHRSRKRRQSSTNLNSDRFDRLEWAGAFGDLGTLIPFVVAYIGVLKIDPLGVLFAFGAAIVVSGLFTRRRFLFNR